MEPATKYFQFFGCTSHKRTTQTHNSHSVYTKYPPLPGRVTTLSNHFPKKNVNLHHLIVNLGYVTKDTAFLSRDAILSKPMWYIFLLEFS